MYSCSFPVYFNSPHTPPLSYSPSCVFFSIWRQWWKLPSLHHDRIRANSLTFAPCCKCQVSFMRPVISLLNNSRQNAHTPLRNVCVAMCRNGICPSEDDYNFDFLKFMVLAGKSSCSPVSTEPTHINQDFMRTEASWKGEKKEMWSCDRVSPIHCRHLSQQLGHPGCVENQISKLRPLQSNQWFMQQKKKKKNAHLKWESLHFLSFWSIYFASGVGKLRENCVICSFTAQPRRQEAKKRSRLETRTGLCILKQILTKKCNQ